MNAKKRILIFAVMLAGMLGFSNNELLAQIQTAQSGNWTDGATWVGGVAPGIADDVQILTGHTVTVNTSPSIKSLDVQGTGVIRPDLSTARVLTVNDGTLQVGAAAAFQYNNASGRLSVILVDVTLVNNGTMGFENVTINGSVTNATNSTITVYGNWGVGGSGNYDATNGTITFSNSTAKTISNLGNLGFFNLNIATNSSVSTSTDMVIKTDWTVATGAVFGVTGNAIITHDGGDLNSTGTLTFGANSTYSITANVNIKNSLSNFSGSLNLGGGVTLTMGDNGTSVLSGTGGFSVGSASTIVLRNVNGLNGAIALTGTRNFGTNTNLTFLSGNSTVGLPTGLTSVGTVTAQTGASVTNNQSFTLTGNLETNGTGSFSASSGTVTLSGTNSTVINNAAGSITLNSIIVAATTTAGSYSNATGTLVINGDLSVLASGSLTPAGAAHAVSFPGTTTITNAGTLTQSAWTITGTVTLGSNLTFAGAGAVVLNGANAVLDASTHTIALGGSGTPQLTFTAGTFKTANAGGIFGSFSGYAADELTAQPAMNYEFYGSAPTSLGLGFGANIGGLGVNNINAMANLTVGGSATITGTGSAAAPTTLSGNLTVQGTAYLNLSGDAQGAIVMNTGATTSITVASTATLRFRNFTKDGVGTVTTTSNFTVANPGVFTNTAGNFTASGSSTITMNTQDASIVVSAGALTFKNLILDGTLAQTTVASFNVDGDLLLAASDFTPAATSVITFRGTNNRIADAGGALTFYTATFGAGSSYSTDADITISGTGAGQGLNVASNATFNATAGDITFTGALGEINTNNGGSLSLFDMTVNHAGTTTKQANTTVNIKNDLDVNAGAYNGTDATSIDNLLASEADNLATITVGGTYNVGTLNLNNTSGTYTLTSGDVINIPNTNVIELVAGALLRLDRAAGTLSITNAGTGIFRAKAGSTIELMGTADHGLNDEIAVVASNVFENGVNYLIRGIIANAGLNGLATGGGVVTGDVRIFTTVALTSLGADVNIGGNLVVETGSSLDLTGTDDVTMSGTNKQIINNEAIGDMIFQRLTIAAGATITTSSSFEVSEAAGTALTVTTTGSLIASAGQIALTGAASGITKAATGTLTFYDLIVEGAGCTINDAATGVTTIANDLSIPTGGDLDSSPGILSFSSVNGTGDINVVDAASLLVAQLRVIGVMADPSLNNIDIEITGTAVNAVEVTAAGSFIAHATSVINLSGAAPVIVNNGTLKFGDLTTDNAVDVTTASSFEIQGDLTLGGVTASLNATAGEISFSGTGVITPLVNAAAGTAGVSFNNVKFLNGSAVTQTGNFEVLVNGNVTVDAGGSFAPGTGTVILAGATAKSITNNGTLNFTNLEIANTTGNNVTTSTGFTVTGGNFNIGTNASFVADGGTVKFGPLAVAFDNVSDQATKAVFFGLEFNGAVTHTIAAGNQISVKENMTFGDGVTVTHTSNATSRITFNGAGPQDIVVGDGITVNLENVTLNNTNGMKFVNSGAALADDEFIINRTFLLSNGNFDLNGSNVLTIGTTDGRLQESAGNTVINNGIASSTGNLYYKTANGAVANLLNVNLGGLGARITTNKTGGLNRGGGIPAIEVRRYHIARENLGGSVGISRYYEIISETGIDSRLVFTYDDNELGSNSEANLVLLSSSTDNGPWVARTATLDATSQPGLGTLTETGIDGYTGTTSYFTAGVPVTITVTEIEGTTKGLASSPLAAFSDNHALLGLKFVATGASTVEQLVFTLSNALAATPQFNSYKLVKSTDNDFTTTGDNETIADGFIGGAATNTSLTFTNISGLNLSVGQPVHLFLVANVDASVTAATQAIQVSLTESNITVDGALVKTFTSAIAGVNYSFVPGIRVQHLPVGLANAPLIAGATNNGIFGYTIKATSVATYTGITLRFDNNVSDYLTGGQIYVSSDDDFSTTGNNTLIASTVVFGGDSLKFTFNANQNLITTDKYYFVAMNTKGNADENVSSFTPSLLHTEIATTSAGYTFKETSSTTAATKVDGLTFDFAKSEATVSLSEMNGSTSSFLGTGVTIQTVLAFSVSSDNGNQVQFTGVTAQVDLTEGAKVADYTQIRLWHDANENGVADAGEQIAVGTINPSVSKGNLTFTSFSAAQNITSTRRYLVTLNVASSATVANNSKLRVSIPDQDYITMAAPTSVNPFGPLEGTHYTVKHNGTATKVKIAGNYKTSIQTGNTIAFAVQAFDANDYPANVTAIQAITMNVSSSDGTTLSNNTGNIAAGTNRVSITPTLTNAAGTTSTTLVADAASLTDSDNTSNITIYLAAPTTDGSAITVALTAGSEDKDVDVSSWVNGNGTGRLIVLREGRAPHAPTNGVSYVAEANIREAASALNQTGPGSFVVFNGSGAATPFTVSNLTPGKTYYFAIYEYLGTAALTTYKTLTPIANSNPVSIKTNAGSFVTNTDSTAASMISTDVVVESALTTSNEAEWFQFFIPTNRNNALVQIYDLPKDYNIEMWDLTNGFGDLVLVRNSEVRNTGKETMILNNANAGRYLIKIYGSDATQFSSTNYKIKVTTSAREVLSQVE